MSYHSLVQYITRDETRAAMVAAGAKITHTGDKWWILPTDDEVMKRALASVVREKEYVAETHDCDNYALELAACFSGTGYCFGIAWGIWPNKPKPEHAINFYINDKRQLVLFDPMTYTVAEPPAIFIMMLVC